MSPTALCCASSACVRLRSASLGDAALEQAQIQGSARRFQDQAHGFFFRLNYAPGPAPSLSSRPSVRHSKSKKDTEKEQLFRLFNSFSAPHLIAPGGLRNPSESVKSHIEGKERSS